MIRKEVIDGTPHAQKEELMLMYVAETHNHIAIHKCCLNESGCGGVRETCQLMYYSLDG